MRRFWVLALSCLAMAEGTAAADYRTLRRLEAPQPVTVEPLPSGAAINPVQLTRARVQPREGEGWALLYTSIPISDPDNPLPRDRILPWTDGPSNSEIASFSRIFDEELHAAGFRSGGEASLFEERSAPDLQVGVLVDDIKGRFCRDCPNIFQRDKIAAVVTMNARWEVYSSLRGEVVARVTTSTGAVWRKPVTDTAVTVIYEAFRENVRALLATEEFRRAVTASPTVAPRPALTPIGYRGQPPGKRTIASSAASVAAIFANDGHGSGFLISPDGYLLTNHHVVGGARFVKVRWADGAETVGEVVRSDRRRDIALVKADPGPRQALALRASAPALGESVYAIGTPLEARFQGSVTKGIVSATRTYDGLPYLQSDVSVNGGNSGGPLVDEAGAVVGITVWGMNISGAPVGVNLFIPIDDALRTLALQPTP